MKTVGIIAEYNPFHTGHEYHLRKAKERSGADYAIVVMSPDFVQRGEPALLDKYTRTRMALACGADLVLELPVCYAAGSAEYFAEGAVALLDRLGVVDTLCFGAENNDIRLFHLTARILASEPQEYRLMLQENLKKGMSFPQARSEALAGYLCNEAKTSAEVSHELKHFLETPNNILGIEYCKALQKNMSQIVPLPITRTGSDYNSRSLEGVYCSASAIREAVKEHALQYDTRRSAAVDSNVSNARTPKYSDVHSCTKNSSFVNRKVLSYIPSGCQELFEEAGKFCLSPDDLTPFLQMRLLDLTAPGQGVISDTVFSDASFSDGDGSPSKNSAANVLTDILDISEDLADRIWKLRFSCMGKSFEECVSLLKTRQMTETRIRRALLHLILNIRANETEALRQNGTAFYARVLGFRKDASALLHHIKEESGIPLITKTANADKLIPPEAMAMWEKDIYASHLYRGIKNTRYSIPFRTEYEISPIII